MNGLLPIQEPGHRAAADEWIRSSLSSGLVISQVVASELSLRAGAAYVLADDHPKYGRLPEDFEHGRGGSLAEAEAAVAQFLTEIPQANLLLVEDDLRLRTDPEPPAGLWGHVVFFGDAVVRWIDLPESAASTGELLRRGASGYTLNAFLSRAGSGSFGLSPRRRMAADVVEAIAKEVCGIIVSAYDGEAYLLWLADDVVASGK